jgi:hypothetical protein
MMLLERQEDCVPEVVPAARLRAFLDGDPAADDLDPSDESLAYLAFYVEEQVLGPTPSRFVGEGGVRFNSVQDYEVTPESLGALAVKRRGLADIQVELLKFRFTIDRLPPSRSYTSVTVRITLDPLPTALMFVPDYETVEAELETTSGSEFMLDVVRLIQMHLTEKRGKTVRRTERYPVVTALDLRDKGFGWTFEAQDGAPLFPRAVTTMALIEVPRGTTKLNGKFDSEALINRHLLGTSATRRAAPVNSADKFTVDLTAAPLSEVP